MLHIFQRKLKISHGWIKGWTNYCFKSQLHSLACAAFLKQVTEDLDKGKPYDVFFQSLESEAC